MKVIRYQSIDGILHETEEECAARDLSIRIRDEVFALEFDLRTLCDGDDYGYDGRILHDRDIPEFIADNAVFLFGVLSRAMELK